MAERERVRSAIEAPVDAAAKLLDESAHADVETRLAMLIDGWGRGLAAGLEELAIAVAELRRAPSVDDVRTQPPATHHAPEAETSNEEAIDNDDHVVRSEDELRAEAARSREATAALREESST
jgi:hypothetical protein